MITVKQILAYFPNKSDDPAFFTSRLPIVYVQYIRPFLGASFYNELLTQYNTDTLTVANKEFMQDYLQPIIAHYAMYSGLAIRRAEPAANGILQTLPEFGQSPTEAQVSLSTNAVLSAAESLVKYAKDFLRENANSYPLYSCTDKISGGFGLYLGDSNSQVFLDKNR